MNRIELIKQAAEKVKAQAEFKRRQKFNSMMVRRWTDVEEKASKVKKLDDEYTDDLITKLDDNSFNHWQDASKFADTHYGDVARNTLKEWDE